MAATITATADTLVHRPRLHGRVTFVTEGTRGIGGAICHSVAELGADVAARCSRDQETAEAFIDELGADREQPLDHRRNGQHRLGQRNGHVSDE